MTTLLELKEKLIRFYGKNEIYVKPAIRFVLALFTFLVINNSIGYMKLVSKTPVAVILALVCSMLPVNGLIAIAALVVLADLSGKSSYPVLFSMQRLPRKLRQNPPWQSASRQILYWSAVP